MAHAGEEKDMKELDSVGIATNSEIHPDLVARDRDDSSEDEVAIFDHEKTAAHHEKDLAHTTELTRHRTDATGVTSISEAAEPGTETRTRWKRWNPLKRKPPPIPKTRGVSREYTASFWSMLTFQWVTPIMSVSLRI
jgi:ATP-binding cassette subfamily C (CFTR/MRP) protein 1